MNIANILWPQKQGTKFVFRAQIIFDGSSDIILASVQSSKKGVQQGTLSGPTRTHDGQHLPGFSDPAHPVQNLLTLPRSADCCYCNLQM